MAREENAIFTVLCMVYDDNGNILVEDRIDPSWAGIALPGGHVEPEESFTQAAIRETREEVGLRLEKKDFKLLFEVADGSKLYKGYYTLCDWAIQNFKRHPS